MNIHWCGHEGAAGLPSASIGQLKTISTDGCIAVKRQPWDGKAATEVGSESTGGNCPGATQSDCLRGDRSIVHDAQCAGARAHHGWPENYAHTTSRARSQ